MSTVMSACGVLCSGCPAFHGKDKGVEQQKIAAEAWKRIFKLRVEPQSLTCGGCQGPKGDLYPSCKRCKAQQCCRKKGLRSCAECSVEPCALLEHAQALWDGVPKLERTLSRDDFITYVKPYCGHRERLQRARAGGLRRPSLKQAL